MNVLDKLISVFSPEAGVRRAVARSRLGAIEKSTAKYDAESRGRRGWKRGSDGSANQEIRSALTHVRAFSRDLRRNNPYAAKISDSLTFNVVGAGIVPGAKVVGMKKGGPLKRKQKRAQELMQNWAYSVACDADAQFNLYGLQSLAFRTENDSGEALIVKQVVNDSSLEIPLRIRVLEGDFLDETKNEVRADGSRIVQGVEFDNSGQRTYYWLFEEHPGEQGMRRFNSRRVPAADVIHLYEVRRPGQVRGMPRGVAGFMRLKNIDEFQDAHLALQKIAACFGVWVRTENPEKKVGDILPEKAEPASVTRLGYGENIEITSPPTANGQETFLMNELLAACAPSGVTYQAATGDLRQVNFSSGKMGFIEMGRTIGHLQKNVMIPKFCQGIEKWFLEVAELKGYDVTGVYFEWTPPRREMIDPPKEVPAVKDSIQGRLKSFSDWARENNRDPEEWAREMADDAAMFKQFGLDLFEVPTKKPVPEVKPDADEQENRSE